ncbi:MAG: hypothetical protein EA378_04545 [Phycisphaerales bacterium]|nr:MAG: hypothetical protein EA378_04545 [Phycisphaerales bacterium]
MVIHAESLKAAWRGGRAAGLAPKLLRRASMFGPPVFCQIGGRRPFELFPNAPWWARLAMGGNL